MRANPSFTQLVLAVRTDSSAATTSSIMGQHCPEAVICPLPTLTTEGAATCF
jgi:hypothetical protein